MTTTGYRLVGLAGDTRGFDEALVWRLPVVTTDSSDAPLVATSAFWSDDDLVDEEGAVAVEELDSTHLSVVAGDVVLIAGQALANRLRGAGLNLPNAVVWTSVAGGRALAVGSLDVFDAVEFELAQLLRGAFSRSIGTDEDPGAPTSLARLIARNGKIDRLTRHVYSSLALVRLQDIEGLRQNLRLVYASTGVDDQEFLSLLQRHAELHRATTGSSALEAELNAALTELQPRIRVTELPYNVQLRLVADRLNQAVDKAKKMQKPLTLDCTGLGSARRISTPSLALLNHVIGLGGVRGVGIVTEETSSEVGPASDVRPSDSLEGYLFRSGLGGAIRRTAGLAPTVADERNVPLSFGQLDYVRGEYYNSRPRRDTRTEFEALEIHRPAHPGSPQDLFTANIPHWLRRGCPSLGQELASRVAAVVAGLVKNVRDYGGLTTPGVDHSQLVMSTTSGGSGNRLWIVVGDNGRGIMAAIDDRVGDESAEAEVVIHGLLDRPTSTLATRIRKSTRAGWGLSDTVEVCRSVGSRLAEEYDGPGLQASMFLFTSSRRQGAVETVIATVSHDEAPTVSVCRGQSSATGTMIVLEIPLLPTAEIDEPEVSPDLGLLPDSDEADETQAESWSSSTTTA